LTFSSGERPRALWALLFIRSYNSFAPSPRCVVFLNEKENYTCFVFFDKEETVWNFILIWVERSISNSIKGNNIFEKLGNEQEFIFISSKI